MRSYHCIGVPMVVGRYGNYNPRVCCGCSRLTPLSNYSNTILMLLHQFLLQRIRLGKKYGLEAKLLGKVDARVTVTRVYMHQGVTDPGEDLSMD